MNGKMKEAKQGKTKQKLTKERVRYEKYVDRKKERKIDR
jgi:hypothetical protein